MRTALLAAVFGAAIAVVSPAWAETTDILRVPTGEVRPSGAFDVSLLAETQFNDDDSDDGDDIGLTFQSGFGVFDRLEVGFDVVNIDDDPDVRADIAYQLLERTGPTGLSAKFGVDRIGEQEDTRVFAVGTYDTGPGAFTAGVGYIDDEYGLLFGGELELGDRWGAFGEYSSISDDEARIGARYAFRPGLRSAIYYAREDSGDADLIGLEIRLGGRLDAVF